MYRAMVNIIIRRKTKFEDFIAIDTIKDSYVLPKKHMVGLSLIVIIAALFVLPIQTYNSVYDQRENLTEQYILADDSKNTLNIHSNPTDTSKENYEDYDIPKKLFDDNAHTEALLAQEQGDNIADTDINDAKNAVSEQVATQKDNNTLAHVERPSGSWYQQTVKSGDSLSNIFTYLNLPYTTLSKITSVAKNDDLKLNVGDKLFFLIDKDNVVKEMVKPLDNDSQVRFTRMSAKDNFVAVYEKINSHIDDPQAIDSFKDASAMPLAVAGAKKRELAAQRAILTRELEKEKRKALNINPTRPRLVIGVVAQNESFKSAARRVGLTPSEISTITEQYSKKININQIKQGDAFRVLFDGIGTSASISAVELNVQGKKIAFYRNAQDHLFYTESGYIPTAGVFKRFPLAGKIQVSSKFNPHRLHPVTKRIAPHKGVDFRAPVGTPVYCPSDGVVTFAGYQRAAGYYIIIRHRNNYSTVYMHLSKMDVAKGDSVTVGQVIAKTGNTGRTTGPHLHYEIRINDRAVDPLNVDLPKNNMANAALAQKKSFENSVKVYKDELYKDSLAVVKN